MSSKKTEGRVIDYIGGFAEVEISPPKECSGCTGCGHSKKRKVKIPAGAGLAPGDKVILALDCGSLVRISFFAYFLPAVFLFVGFLAGYFVWGNPGGLAGGFFFLFSGSLITGRLTREKYKAAVRIDCYQK